MKMKVIEVKIEDGRIKISSEEVNAIGGSDYDLDKQRIESKEYTRKLLRVYKDIGYYLCRRRRAYNISS